MTDDRHRFHSPKLQLNFGDKLDDEGAVPVSIVAAPIQLEFAIGRDEWERIKQVVDGVFKRGTQ